MPFVARTCPRMAPCTAPLKDASRRTRAVAPASAGPILDRGCARRRGVVRPGRRNGPFQPNKETWAGGWRRPPRQGADVSTHVQQRGSNLFELYDDFWKGKEAAKAAQDLVAVAFSLWRAAFLAEKSGKRTE